MAKNEELSHFGIPGMRWGHRRQNVATGQGRTGGRRSDPASMTKNMDGSKRKEIGKNITDALMTPAWSKTKWSDMSKGQKKTAMIITAAAVTASGMLLVSELHQLSKLR